MTAKTQHVSDIMTRLVTTVTPETTRPAIIEAIQLNDIGAVPVVNAGRLVGVISKGDLVTRTGTTASELMTPVIHSVPPDLPVRAAALRMLAMQVHRLFVVDGGVPVGIVTATDFLRDLLGGEARQEVPATGLHRVG